MKRSTIVETISALFILLFVYTALSKLMEGIRFEATLKKSPLISIYATTIAWALPVVELVIASLLLFPRTRLAGLYASTALMAIFTLYLSYMVVFTTKLPCSCGGVLTQMSWKQHIIFNLFYTGLGVAGILLMKRNNNIKLAESVAIKLQAKYSI